ncbi:hypothetical protein Pst134EA_031982 [Puccinia striiformis f. sp. tritici]|uniref:uncharacterized protein n=1 Tax=Puccinia striiformis f. sp. tritici TaxID=168172 RepID=UPI0020086EB5|nr:uncharacterized protein Pst134EA_031982 [Puccinia striiformis f. sp. tritici]KAH9443991.1 hypothetical protein Pst134EB_026377 [Puccinia striiformis f. sp. tritici]KAH9444397.1 hypothetical protein Pst134EA_031982 [Puccinia striiformis f. sp. tritici]
MCDTRFCSLLLLLARCTNGHSWEETAGLISEGSLNNNEVHSLPTPLVYNNPPSSPETLCLFPLHPEGTMVNQKRVASTEDPGHNLSKRLKPSQGYQGEAGTSLVMEGDPATMPSSSQRISTRSSYDQSGRHYVSWNDRTTPSLLTLPCIDSRNGREADKLGPARLNYGSKGLTSSDNFFQPKLSTDQFFSRGAEDSPASHQGENVLPVVRHAQSPRRKESTRINMPQIEHLRGYYSFQTLDWSPSQIFSDAALGAYSLAPKFKSLIGQRSWTDLLVDMEEKYGIFIPFIYRLMTKSLSSQHWINILSVWKGLWDASSRVKPRELSSIETLKLFLGISDLITELTIPQFFERYNTRTKRHAHETKILKALSAGHGEMNQSRWTGSFNYVAEILIKECLINPEINLEKSINQEAAHYLVLQKIKSISSAITANTVDILKSKDTDPPFNAIVYTFQDALLGKTINLVKFQNQWPTYNIKSRIDRILHQKYKLNDQDYNIFPKNPYTPYVSGGTHELSLKVKLNLIDHRFSNIFHGSDKSEHDGVPELLTSKISQILKNELAGFSF